MLYDGKYKKKTTKANTAQRKGRDTERKREGVWSGGCVRGVIKKNLAHGRDTRQDKNQVTWRRQREFINVKFRVKQRQTLDTPAGCSAREGKRGGRGKGKGKLPLNAILVPSQSKVKFNVPCGNNNNETRN